MHFYTSYKTQFPCYKHYLDFDTADEVVGAIGAKKPEKVVKFSAVMMKAPWASSRAIKNLIEAAFHFLSAAVLNHGLNHGQAKKFKKLEKTYVILLSEFDTHMPKRVAQKTEQAKKKAQPNQQKANPKSMPKPAAAKEELRMPADLSTHARYKDRQDFKALVKFYTEKKGQLDGVSKEKAQEILQKATGAKDFDEAKKLYRKLTLITHEDKIKTIGLSENSVRFLSDLFKFATHYYALALK